MFTQSGPPIAWTEEQWDPYLTAYLVAKNTDAKGITRACHICGAKGRQWCLDENTGRLRKELHETRRLNFPGRAREIGRLSEARRRALAKRGDTSHRNVAR